MGIKQNGLIYLRKANNNFKSQYLLKTNKVYDFFQSDKSD